MLYYIFSHDDVRDKTDEQIEEFINSQTPTDKPTLKPENTVAIHVDIFEKKTPYQKRQEIEESLWWMNECKVNSSDINRGNPIWRKFYPNEHIK